MPAPPHDAAVRPAPGPRYHPLAIVLVAVAAGILLDRHWPLRLEAWWALAVAGLAVWAVIRLGRRLLLGRRLHCRPLPAVNDGGSATASPTADLTADPTRVEDQGFFISLAADIALLSAVAAAAGAWHHCQWNLFPADDLGLFARRKAEPACVEAVAVGRPRELPPSSADFGPARDGSRLSVDLIALRDGAKWRPVSGRATLLVLGETPDIQAGDRLRCFAKLSTPPVPLNPGSFDRAARLRSERVLGGMSAEVPQCVSVIAAGKWWNVSRFLDRVRAHGNRVLRQSLDPEQSELAAAVLLGLREELDSGRNEAFLTTGTIHFLSISGLHVSILALALFWIMRYTPVPRGWALAGISSLTLLYALMVDVQPSVVRATVLIQVACLADYLGRRAIGFNSLAAAALVVLAMNPAHLFHVGAQLSFLCVAGLIWLAPQRPHWTDEEKEKKADRTLERLVLQNLGWPSRIWRQFRRSLAGMVYAGGVLWLLTLPLVMARFHIFSPVALILNVLLWPLMSLSLLTGFGVVVLGLIHPSLGHLFGGLCNVSFRWLEESINLAQRVPHYWFPGPADWWLWVFFGALGAWWAFPRLRPPRRWRAGLLAAWTAVGFVAAGNRAAPDRLDCTFLGVGHGCATLLELPSGRTMLCDAGQLGAPKQAARTISEFLWDRGLTHLDAVVISHPDADHYNALPELLDRFSVGVVYVSPVMFDERSPLLDELQAAFDRHGVAVRAIRAGDRLQAGGGCSIEVLHPPRGGVLGSNNANSVVLAVECFKRRILLTGDIEPPGLDDLLAEEPMRCDVLLAPHHGSRASNSPELAEWCRPRWVVLSGDGRWNAADIEAGYRAGGGRVLQTSDRGAIRARVSADGIQLSGFVEPPPAPSQRSTTISPGARNRGWRKITFNRPGNAFNISRSCRSVAMMYDRQGWARKSASCFNAARRSPSQRVTGPPE